MKFLAILAALILAPNASAFDLKTFYSLRCRLVDSQISFLLDRAEIGLNLNKTQTAIELVGDGVVRAPLLVKYTGLAGRTARFSLSMQLIEMRSPADSTPPRMSETIDVNFTDKDFVEFEDQLIGQTSLLLDPAGNRRYELTCYLHRESALPSLTSRR